MPSDPRDAASYLCRRTLYPLIRMLLRCEISAGDFKAIVDNVYARAGSAFLSAQGERVTMSRLAVITGINRVNLPSILAQPEEQSKPKSRTQTNRACRVMEGWHEDVAFQTAAGAPAVLGIRGAGKTFARLVQRYAGGVPHSSVLSELLRLGAVERVGRNRLRVLRRSLSPARSNIDRLYHVANLVGDVLETMEANHGTPRAEDAVPARIVRGRIDLSTVPLFRRQLGQRADGVIDLIESFLQAHAVANNDSDAVEAGAIVVGVCRASPSGGTGTRLRARTKQPKR